MRWRYEIEGNLPLNLACADFRNSFISWQFENSGGLRWQKFRIFSGVGPKLRQIRSAAASCRILDMARDQFTGDPWRLAESRNWRPLRYQLRAQLSDKAKRNGEISVRR